MIDETQGGVSVEGSAWRQAMRTWSEYSVGTESLVHLTHEGLHLIVRQAEALHTLEAPEEAVSSADHKAHYAQREIDIDYATLHAHSLLGLWGALESLVEDLVIAALTENTGLLLGEKFAKVKLPVSVLASDDESYRLRAILAEASRANSSDLAIGISKFERQLDLANLGGFVPQSIRDAIFEAQQIRNVWAHRAGIADDRLIVRCPRLGFSLGDQVRMNVKLFVRLMHATHMYVVLIANRRNDLLGLPRISSECHGYEHVLDEVPPLARVGGHPDADQPS